MDSNTLIILGVLFALGILGGSNFTVRSSLLISGAALATLLAAIAILISDGRNAKARRGIATMLLILAALMVGATLESIENNQVPANQLRSLLDKGKVAIGEPVELTGVLERDPEIALSRPW